MKREARVIVLVVPALRGRIGKAGRRSRGTALRHMNRRTWLAERRAAVAAQYDAEAPAYTDDLYPTELQRRWVERLLKTCPPEGAVLDAPCGTGKYFDQVQRAGRRIAGIDQSAGMLAQARARGIAFRLEHMGLQELSYAEEFDAAMTIDAMENVAPEDWPLVLANLRRALRPGGHLYMTVEKIGEKEIDSAYEGLIHQGLPAVRGEVVEGDVAGYHYYPDRARVLAWFAAEGFEVIAEDFEKPNGWGYRHFLLRSPGRDS